MTSPGSPRYFASADTLFADLGDGRCARLQEFAQRPAQWELVPPIPRTFDAEPAPVADVAVRYGTWRADRQVWFCNCEPPISPRTAPQSQRCSICDTYRPPTP